MKELFKEARDSLTAELKELLRLERQNLSAVNRWGEDLLVRLSRFTSGGKMIRGSLVLLSYCMFREEMPKWLVQIAAALELIHSSLLIHDDIMDRDTLRRGIKTVFHQYREVGEKESLLDPDHFGLSLGICAGDIGFFLAFKILSQVDTTEHIRRSIFTLWSEELMTVGLAQMQDLYFGSTDTKVSEKDILDMYLHKTARYTFSLPLMSGGIAAEQDRSTLLLLSRLGENLGIIFQIKDDEIGLFGTETETGKPVGSDVKEKKKTLYALYLSELREGKHRQALTTILRKQETSASDIEKLRRIALESGVTRKVLEKVLHLKERAETQIEQLAISDRGKEMLRSILAYNLERSR
jgi:geranylgeranyl diphosphate synthase type I